MCAKILGLGDNIVDRYVDRKLDFPGGNAVNVAVFANRLGAEAGYLGVFADDELAAFLRAALEAEGVDVSKCVVKSGLSGVSRIRVVGGERVFEGWNGGGVTVSDPIDLQDGRLEYAESFDAVHSSVYSRTEEVLPMLSKSAPMLSFDFSSEPEFRSEEYVGRVAPSLDLALLSVSDLDEDESELAIRRVREAGCPLVLATRGEAGATLDFENQRLQVGALAIEPSEQIVDTMGCGDAFLAGFLTRLVSRGWKKGSNTSRDVLEEAMLAGATSSRAQCFVESAFGRGQASPANN